MNVPMQVDDIFSKVYGILAFNGQVIKYKSKKVMLELCKTLVWM